MQEKVEQDKQEAQPIIVAQQQTQQQAARVQQGIADGIENYLDLNKTPAQRATSRAARRQLINAIGGACTRARQWVSTKAQRFIAWCRS